MSKNKKYGSILKELPRLRMPVDDPKEYRRIYQRIYRANENERLRIVEEMGLLRPPRKKR